jgi:endonuclease/exonuclease/phosphatase family metal-dependent hydrolase
MFHGYPDLDTALGLKELRKRIKNQENSIPNSSLDKSINIATWNIRHFGGKRRLNASIHLIAEILNKFDLIAITEVRRNLDDLNRVMHVLGPYWKVVYSDYVPDHGGNWERIAYLYDYRAVAFTGLAAEADAPRKKDHATGEWVSAFSWWRSPFIASFQAGSFSFILITAHIRWGKSAKGRIKPLEMLAEWVDKKRDSVHGDDRDIIVMGDFNIPKIGDALFNAITSKGLQVPDAILGLEHGSNLAKDKRYDQILHYPSTEATFTNNAGVLDFYTGGTKKLFPDHDMTKSEFTSQLSDHLPLWIQVDTDIVDKRLDQVIADRKAEAAD